MPDKVDVAIIGGGAAGLMCALTAGKRGKRVRARVTSKAQASTGGAWNVKRRTIRLIDTR